MLPPWYFSALAGLQSCSGCQGLGPAGSAVRVGEGGWVCACPFVHTCSPPPPVWETRNGKHWPLVVCGSLWLFSQALPTSPPPALGSVFYTPKSLFLQRPSSLSYSKASAETNLYWVVNGYPSVSQLTWQVGSQESPWEHSLSPSSDLWRRWSLLSPQGWNWTWDTQGWNCVTYRPTSVSPSVWVAFHLYSVDSRSCWWRGRLWMGRAYPNILPSPIWYIEHGYSILSQEQVLVFGGGDKAFVLNSFSAGKVLN